ncbi:MAG: sigma-70 family RNA polymerase sigma factor [Kiritimatiellae bacterium]|nr:sigma-70 family RNA polymerase sigma factor [Kiritimatiellia bacterium]
MSIAPPAAGDEALARRAAEGDDAAGAELVRRWVGPLRAYCARRVRPPLDAEDLTQEVLLAVLRRIGRKRSAAPFAPWLFSVARSVVVDAHRALRRRPATIPFDPASPEPVVRRTPAEVAAETDEESQLWREARRTLSARQFEALELRVRWGLDVAAIASAMGLTANHVKVLLFRARQRLLANGAVAAATNCEVRRGAVATAAEAAREG